MEGRWLGESTLPFRINYNMRNVSVPTQVAGLRSRGPLRLFVPPPHSWSASVFITAFTPFSASLRSSSCMSMTPSSNRD